MSDEPKQAPGGAEEGDGEGTLARLKAARRSADAVFGETPIQFAEPPRDDPEEGPDDEGAPALEPRVRHAAVTAAIKAVALAAAASVFMGLILVCALGGLLPGGWSLGLGLFVMLIGIPAAALAGIGSYRQTLETERHKVGLCPQCGYDLRGSMGLRCPECGWRISTPGSTKAPWTDEEQQRENLD